MKFIIDRGSSVHAFSSGDIRKVSITMHQHLAHVCITEEIDCPVSRGVNYGSIRISWHDDDDYPSLNNDSKPLISVVIRKEACSSCGNPWCHFEEPHGNDI